MDNAVKRRARHDVDEERCDLVKAVEYQRVTPHDDCHSIVSESQTVGGREEPLRLRKDPETQHQQHIDEVAEIGQEVVISTSMVCEDTNGHEVDELGRIPDVKPLRIATHQIPTRKDVHNAADKGYLLSEADGLCIIPLLAELLNSLPHALPISFELFIGRGDTPPPFLHHSVAGILGSRLESISRPSHLVGLGRYTPLELLELLGQGKVVQQVEDGQAVKRREGIPVVLVCAAATGEGRVP